MNRHPLTNVVVDMVEILAICVTEIPQKGRPHTVPALKAPVTNSTVTPPTTDRTAPMQTEQLYNNSNTMSTAHVTLSTDTASMTYGMASKLVKVLNT